MLSIVILQSPISYYDTVWELAYATHTPRDAHGGGELHRVCGRFLIGLLTAIFLELINKSRM